MQRFVADDTKHINLDVERQVHLLVAEAKRPIGIVHAPERGLHHALVSIFDMLAGDRFDPFDDRVSGRDGSPAAFILDLEGRRQRVRLHDFRLARAVRGLAFRVIFQDLVVTLDGGDEMGAGAFDSSPVTGEAQRSLPLTSTRLPAGSLATSAARVVSVARIRAMSLRELRQLHRRKQAVGTSTIPISTSQGTMRPSLLREPRCPFSAHDSFLLLLGGEPL